MVLDLKETFSCLVSHLQQISFSSLNKSYEVKPLITQEAPGYSQNSS